MKEYDNQEEQSASMAAEPQVAYGESQQIKSIPLGSSQNIPLGYMSLERFGELFHQKLDACYAELQGDSKQ
jgi:hypothetical protein